MTDAKHLFQSARTLRRTRRQHERHARCLGIEDQIRRWHGGEAVTAGSKSKTASRCIASPRKLKEGSESVRTATRNKASRCPNANAMRTKVSRTIKASFQLNQLGSPLHHHSAIGIMRHKQRAALRVLGAVSEAQMPKVKSTERQFEHARTLTDK